LRVFRTDMGFYDTLREARAAIRRAIARREVLRKPKPGIVKWRDGSYLVVGSLITSSWAKSKSRGGAVRDVLLGTPVKTPRPLTRRASTKKDQKRRRSAR
jgi:hypothetical protein